MGDQLAILERPTARALDQCFGAPCVILQRARTAQELESDVATYLLPAHDLDRAHLAGAARMGAAARRHVPFRDLDDPDPAGDRRRLAECEALQAGFVDPVERELAVLPHDLVGCFLDALDGTPVRIGE